MRLSLRYAILFLLIFGIEVIIAKFFDDQYIRPLLGDFLIVFVIYYFMMTFIKAAPGKMAVGVWGFAVLVEFTQYLELAKHLKIEDQKWAQLLLGSTFDPWDLVMYTLGAFTIMFLEFRKLNKV